MPTLLNNLIAFNQAKENFVADLIATIGTGRKNGYGWIPKTENSIRIKYRYSGHSLVGEALFVNRTGSMVRVLNHKTGKDYFIDITNIDDICNP